LQRTREAVSFWTYVGWLYLAVVLAQAGISVNMSRTGNRYDNAVTGSFFGTLKGECVERSCLQTLNVLAISSSTA
jgi:transposase InsO family protein